MHRLFTRTLERRGIYTGSGSIRWTLPVQRPVVYAVFNAGGSDMIRIEVGVRGRFFWIDWGRGRSAD